MLLASAVDELAILKWQKTKAGQKNRDRPEPIPRPGVTPRKRQTKGVAMPFDQFKAHRERMMKAAAAAKPKDEVRVYSGKV